MNISRALRAVLRVVVCLHLGSAAIGLAATDWSPATLLTQPFDISSNIIQLTPGTRWGLFRESDSITITTTNASPIQVFDLNGNSVYSGSPTTFTLPRGHYVVECNGDRTQFCVLPNDYAGAPFLGSETDNWSDSSAGQRMTEMGISWVRMVQSIWENVETNRNAWDWSSVDKAVTANPGRKIIAMSASLVPSWVGPDEIAPLHAAYVQALATRYKGKLAAIEIWNEPLGGKFSNATNVDSFVNLYLQIFSQARQAIKAVDSTPQIIGPAWTSLPQLESLSMATNPLATFDGWSWHDYYRGFFAPDVDYLSPDLVRSISTDHLEWTCGRFADLPSLFVDELGLYGRSALGTDTGTNIDTHLASSLDWYRGMCRAIKTTVMYRAAGISCIIPHVLPLSEDLSNPNFELCGWDNGFRGPHPKTSAFLMTCYWLNGATLAGYRNPGTNAFLYAWQLADNSSLVVAWAPEGQTIPLQVNALVTTDIYGRTNSVTALSEEPVLFHSNDPDALTLLSAVRSNIVGTSNFAPVMDPLPTESIVAGQQLQLTVSASDADNDPITFSTTALPLGATFDPGTHTLSWTPAGGASGPYTATFVAADSQGATDSISTTITVLGNLFDGLLAHWKLDESAGTVAVDSAGTNNGTLTGFNFTTNSGHVSGILSNALSFDGVDDFVALDGNQIDLTNNFTATAWLYPRNASTAGAFIAVRSFYLASGFRFFIYNNSVFVQGQTTAGWQASTFGTGAIQNGSWYHLAVVDDNSIITVYVNGVSLGSADWGGDVIMNTNSFSRIGSDATEGADYFNGVIDDVMLFERALTSPQIETLYQSANQPLTISRLQGTLNFAQTNADTCTVKGTFTLPPDYNFSNKVVTLNVGGAETSFTLDSKGRGLSGLSRFNKPSYNKTTGLWTFNAILRSGSWHTSWAAHGLVNASIVKPGVHVTLPVILAIDNESFTATPSRQYTSQAGKSGIAR